jgi:AcrR family transcriptional regulator
MSPRPRLEDAHAELATKIKVVARQQMAEHGTAGISLRGIARALGITAPAIYNYYPRLDDLITALIVDAYTDIADRMDAAVASVGAGPWRDGFVAGALTYRAWALEHPVEFQLIYGNPIPGYVAPTEVTQPLARRPFAAMGNQLIQAWMDGELHLLFSAADLPESIVRHLESLGLPGDLGIPVAPLYALITGWTRLHGLVTLELFHHLQPLLGDTEALYRHEVEVMAGEFGGDHH